VANYKSAVLVIQAASNGAVAAKLRQMAPTLVSELLRRGLECTGVQVKVQARPGEKRTRVPEPRPLSAKPSQEIAALSASAAGVAATRRHSKTCSRVRLDRNDRHPLENHQRENQ
jgi:hypothetical protein